jgi:hypothetical protein
MLFISNALVSLVLPLFNLAYGNEGKIFPPDRVLFWKNAIALPVTIAAVYTAAMSTLSRVISSTIVHRSCTYYFFCMSIFDGVFLATLLRALSQIVASKYIEEYGFYSALRHAIVPKFVVTFVCWLLNKAGYENIRPTDKEKNRGEFEEIHRDKDNRGDGAGGDYWDPDDNFSDYFAILTLLPYAIYFTVTTFTIVLGILSYPAFHVNTFDIWLILGSFICLLLCVSSRISTGGVLVAEHDSLLVVPPSATGNLSFGPLEVGRARVEFHQGSWLPYGRALHGLDCGWRTGIECGKFEAKLPRQAAVEKSDACSHCKATRRGRLH